MDVTAFNISKHLTDLIGRHVGARVLDTGAFTPATRAACYRVVPNDGTAVVQIDFHLLTALGGALIGFSPAQADAQVSAGKLDENFTDATNEVLNVLSAVVVSEGRAIFKGVYQKAGDYSQRAQELLKGGFYPLKLQVTPSGGRPGMMWITSDSV